MFGVKVTLESGKINWQLFRRTLYTAIIVWVLAIRIGGINPFDDFGEGGSVGFHTLFDAISILGAWLLVWHLLWPIRPKIS